MTEFKEDMGAKENYTGIILGMLFGVAVVIIILAFISSGISEDYVYCQANTFVIDYIQQNPNTTIDLVLSNFTVSFPCLANFSDISPTCVISPI